MIATFFHEFETEASLQAALSAKLLVRCLSCFYGPANLFVCVRN